MPTPRNRMLLLRCLSVALRRALRHGFQRSEPAFEVGAHELVHVHEQAEGLAGEVVLAVHRPGDLGGVACGSEGEGGRDRKSTRLNSSHVEISYAVFCLKKKKNKEKSSEMINEIVNLKP